VARLASENILCGNDLSYARIWRLNRPALQMKFC
jgi:hypothetical protein